MFVGFLGLGVVEMLWFGCRIESCVSGRFGRLGLRRRHSRVAGPLSLGVALVGELALCLFRLGYLGEPARLCRGIGLCLPGPKSRYLVYGDGESLENQSDHPVDPH